MQDTGYKMQDAGYKMQDTRYKMQDAGCRIKRLRNAELKPEALNPWPRPDFDRVSVITYASKISP